jgi:sugar/nucleoside kinase (ribokinase family)
MVKNILSRRQEHAITEKPLFLWEPVPGVCSPNDWKDCIEAMKYVDVITPNVNEAAGFLGREIDEEQPLDNFKLHVEKLAEKYASHQSGAGKAVVIRCGKHGCLLRSESHATKWFPAHHQTRENVVDPTGGGNAFCGGFCAGWVQSAGDVEWACLAGNVAASFVIEQFGFPELSFDGDGCGEKWNAETVKIREDALAKRSQNV